jgi:hypothetical protein
MKRPSPRRLVLGIAAVALLAAFCVFAVSSVRGRLRAAVPVAAVPEAGSAALQADNARLRAEVARLIAERDAALARATASPVPPLPQGAAEQAPAPQPAEPARASLPPHRAAVPAAPSNGFTEPQTFESVSTTH